MTRRAIALVLLVLLVTSSAAWLLAQGASVLDGVYTSEQSASGQALYRDNCASCHGEALDGHGQAPALTGSEFATSWNDAPVWDLFNKIQTTMPADDPGQLSPEQTATIVAHIFKANNFPAGSTALPTSEDALKAIRIVAPAK